jgi:hypothetical protein
MSYADFWYVRFPDGRILRAASTVIVRQELAAGHIPVGSTVRRSPNEEWVSLEWTQEFADLVEQRSVTEREPRHLVAETERRTGRNTPDHPVTVASRLDPSRLHLLGVRGYLDELLAALDSTLIGKKLFVAALAAILLSGLLAIEEIALFHRSGPWPVLAWGMVVLTFLVLACATGLITQLTYVELSRLRPARWQEGLTGLAGLTLRLAVLFGIVGGSVWGLIVLLRWLPIWLLPGSASSWSAARQAAADVALVLSMVFETLLWPLCFLAWLAAPILAVEDASIGRGLWRWLSLMRQDLGRAFLYQAMAVGLGLLLTAPFLLLLVPVLSRGLVPALEVKVAVELEPVASLTRSILFGLACAPLLAYWIVAHVFIYLNLRYGVSNRR